MNRKNFLQTIVPLSLASFLAKNAGAVPFLNDELRQSIIPRYLKAGDTIGITCPANPVENHKLHGCLRTFRNIGLNVVYGNTVGKSWQRFSSNDKERASDFQRLLDDDKIDAILFGRGGYGTLRMIDRINWDKFKQNPKWLIGFSDITAFHLHVHANFGIATIHGDMAGSISDQPNNLGTNTLLGALFGNRIEYAVNGHSMNREGFAQGKLVGGNLSLIQACAGSKSDIKTDGKILFIEDVSEYKYTIDRMLMNLKRSGKLENLAGLVVGQFTATKTSEDERNFTDSIEEIIMDKVEEYNYPVCFNFPSGHSKNNRALKLGVSYDLNVSYKSVSLFETVIKNGNGIPTLQLQDSLKVSSDTLLNK